MSGNAVKKSKADVIGSDDTDTGTELETTAKVDNECEKAAEEAMGPADLHTVRSASLDETYALEFPLLGPEFFVTSKSLVPAVRVNPKNSS